MAPATSEPVQERSIATRQALIDAAVVCLLKRGYAGFTTIEVSRLAGVSRGAQLHHFPSKADLLSTAIEHLLHRRIDEFRRLLAGMRPHDTDVGAHVDALWQMFDEATFALWAELWIAARTDHALAARMTDVDRRFTDETRSYSVELMTMSGADPATLEMLRDFAFAVMDGIALQRLNPRGQRPVADYLSVLKVFITDQLGRAAGSSRSDA